MVIQYLHTVYLIPKKTKDGMKSFRIDLKEHATKIIIYGIKQMISLTIEKSETYNDMIANMINNKKT